MKIKRILILAIALVTVVFSFGSCDEKDAAKLYNTAMEKLAALEYIQIKADANVEIATEGLSYEMPMDALFRIIKNDKNPVFDTALNMEMMGMKFNIGVYYADGYMYLSAIDTKSKTPFDFSEFSKDEGADITSDEFVFDIPDELLKDTEVTVEDGKRSFSTTLDGNELYKKLISLSKQEMESELEEQSLDMTMIEDMFNDDSISIGDIVVDICIDKEGYLESYAISAPMKYTNTSIPAEERSATDSFDMKLTLSIVFENIGETFTIDPPANIEEYTEAETY